LNDDFVTRKTPSRRGFPGAWNSFSLDDEIRIRATRQTEHPPRNVPPAQIVRIQFFGRPFFYDKADGRDGHEIDGHDAKVNRAEVHAFSFSILGWRALSIWTTEEIGKNMEKKRKNEKISQFSLPKSLKNGKMANEKVLSWR
jgi:hypothetical protein